jgi:hypothetical protein
MGVVGSIHKNAKVDQCDQGGHSSSCYTVLIWDLGKGSKVTNVKHSAHLIDPTHVGISFTGF